MKQLEKQLKKIFLSMGGNEAQSKIASSQKADYQNNGALSLAKQLKHNPKELAKEIVQKIKCDYAEIFITDPGFININLKDKFILSSLEIKASINKNILVDFSSPNIAKSMHVGHLRSTIIGSALYHMYKIAGASVVSDNHLGDWGTPMGIVLTKIKDLTNFSWDIKEIEKIYVEGSKLYKTSEEFKTLVQKNTNSLQQKEDPFFSLWKKLVEVTKKELLKDYTALNVSFDMWKGESYFEEQIPKMMNELKEKNLLKKSDGATILPLDSEIPLVLEKANGGYLYSTSDLACLKHRNNYDNILYVVDKRQSLHFKQLFEAGKICGYSENGVHVSFGTINGLDGKPFKTRDGEVLKFSELISQSKEKASQKLKELNPQMSNEDNQKISALVGIGALKFAELKHHRESDYVFDLNKFISLEGFTGPYVMYQTLRAKSILSKTKEIAALDKDRSLEENERKLALLMSKTSLVMKSALSCYMPHYLCEHLYEMCQAFSIFYSQTPILKEMDETKRKHYLGLVEHFYNQGSYIFKALNIDLPEEM